MKRTLLAWPLIALVPFAGIRMICVEAPRARSVASASAGHCDELCPRPRTQATTAGRRDAPVTPVSPGESDGPEETTCTLFSDGSLTVLVSGVAMLPAAPPVQFSFTTRPLHAEVQDFYLAPPLAHLSPPPKA